MRSKEKITYLMKNTGLFAISSFGSKLLVFLLIPLYTNLLTTSEYGIADAIITTSNLLVYIFTLNVADGVLRFAIEKKEKQGEILVFGIKVIAIGFVAVAAIILFISKYLPINWPEFCYLFLFLYYFVNTIYSLFSAYLRAINYVKEVAIAGIITTFVMIVSNIVCLVIIRLGLLGYLIALVLGTFVANLYMISIIIKSKTIRSKRCCDRILAKKIMLYSFPLIFNGICWWINNSIDKYFILYYSGTAENGIYSVAGKVSSIILVFQNIFTQAWSLSAIREFDRTDKDGFFSTTYRVYKDGIIFICFLLNLFNIPIAKILFAKEFFVAWKSSLILVYATVFTALGGYLSGLFSASKRTTNLAMTTILGAIVNIVLNMILIPLYGNEGAAIATVISFFVIWVTRAILIRKIISLRMNFGEDFLIFLLLIVQIFLCEQASHYYVLQIVVGMFMVCLKRESVRFYFDKLRTLRKK